METSARRKLRPAPMALAVSLLGWLLIGVGGRRMDTGGIGLWMWAAGGGLSTMSLVLAVSAIRRGDRWISGLAVLLSWYPGVYFPLWLMGRVLGTSPLAWLLGDR